MQVPIYKVNHIINGIIDTIYIFNGKKNKGSISDEDLKVFFSEKEIKNINENKIKIKYSDQTIHFDDSIGTIKLKILNEFKNSISIEEIYLYCQKIETFSSVLIYQTLTQNKKLPLTKVRLDQFISNIVSTVDGNLFVYDIVKDIYDYDDIVKMNLDGKQFIINKVLGQKFFMIENEYPFICNPYDVRSYDSFLERNSRKSLTTLNSHLLLNNGEILNNNIYLCLTQNVLEFDENNNIPQILSLKIYYPFLYGKNINNLEDLNENKSNLLKSNETLLQSNTYDYFKTIDMFYEIYKLRKNELNYINKGIKFIKAVIKPIYNINIPLEIIFKLLHATKDNPFIKYNPSSRQENIYRLFTDKIATDGRKIPYLKKATIFKLIKNIGKTKSVSVYIDNLKNTDVVLLICEFDENGFTTIQAEFKNAIDEVKINELFINSINPIIQEITNLLQQSGYKIRLFDDIKSNDIEIKQLTYQSQIKIKTSINLELYKGCISSIFNNESSSFKKDIHLRFKRVANFNKVTSQEAFILEKSLQGYRGEEIIEELLDNFPDDLTRENAEELVRKVANEIQLERGIKKTDIKIKDNPGFKTTIYLDQLTGIITIDVENINDIEYLSTIPIYIDSMIRITQDKKSTKFPIKEIDKICSSGSEKDDVKIFDIISPVESENSELEIPSIDDENSEVISYKKLSDASDYSNEEKGKNAFDLFYDEDELEEREDSEDSIPSEKLTGGQDSQDNEDSKNSNQITSPVISSEENVNEDVEDQNNIINIDNLSLKKKNPYFETRIERLDPVLIIKEDSKEYNSYSRVCSSSEKRQPVILTDKELNKINKEHPGFLRDEDVIKYGSDPNKQYNYICPRYWCLKNNTIVDPNDLKEVVVNGKKELQSPDCGYVLPLDAKKVQPGYYVYEFYKPKSGKKNYKKYPGFQVDKHPQGYCLPCCFEKYNTIGRIKANKKCSQNKQNNENNEDNEENEINSKEQKSNRIPEINAKEDEYIKGPDKFPLLPGKWGYLQPQIQSILHTVNADCQISKTNTNLKPNHPCLLRHGIEINEKQSFIAAISDVLFFRKVNKVLTIKEMKDLIIQSLQIDEFITYQNGNLVNDFKLSNENLNNYSIDTEKYNTSKLYSKINKSNEEEVEYFKKVVSSLENFINYLKDEDTIIDHTYLWDIISKPNKLLFSKGVNLIIFKIPNDDITNNVDLICPTNHYSNEFYESKKPTIFLIKEDNYYEPIYSYSDNNNKIQIAKDFKEFDPHLSQSMRTVFREVIKPFISVMCKPLASMPNIYKSPHSLLLVELIQKLDKYDYTVNKMVMNFNNKIIGVIAESPTNIKTSCFVPCYPSSYDENIKANLDFVFMTDLSLWRSYEETFTFLNKLYNVSKRRNVSSEIPCKPMLKVVEDSLVVGIITETNQFIQLSSPIPEIDIKAEYNLPSLTQNNYLVQKTNDKDKFISSDAIITTSSGVDTERVEYIKKIKYETQFYNIFRNTIRILLNDYSNIDIREKIESEMLKDYILYSQKLNNITSLLKKLVENKITFTGDSKYYKLIDEMTTCIIKDKESCIKSSNLCMLTETNENSTCRLILPKNNLITNKENEVIYFGKMADELIRYNRIKSYILQPQTFLSFGNIGYNLRDDEIIMLQSLLTQDYFESLVPTIINKYVRYNSYDEAEPIITQKYDNFVEKGKDLSQEICNKTISNKISSTIWNKCFPNNYNEITYSKTVSCSFECIIDIIEKYLGNKIEINIIKNILFEEYKKYLTTFSDKIVDILIMEGKKHLGDKVKGQFLTFAELIYNDNYFLTPFDIWLLVNKYKIPTIFISTKNILQTNYDKNIFVAYTKDDIMGENTLEEKYCFIIIPALQSENIPAYKIVQDNQNNIFISLNEQCNNLISTAIKEKISINIYLEKFKKISKRKNPVFIENDNEDIEVEKQKIPPKIPPKKISKKILIDDTEPISLQPEINIPKKRSRKIKPIILKGQRGGNKTKKFFS